MNEALICHSLRRRCLLSFAIMFVWFGAINTTALSEPIFLDAESTRQWWLFPDGHIIAAERSFENERPIVKRLHCYNNIGQCVWSYSLSCSAIGDIYCVDAPDDLFAVLYHFDGAYYIEFLNRNGELQYVTSIPDASDAFLIEDGLLYKRSIEQEEKITFLDWQGNSVEWSLKSYASLRIGNVLGTKDGLYLHIFHRNTSDEPSSSIISLCKDGSTAWDFFLGNESDCMFTEWAVNQHGGLTIQVQSYSNDDNQSSELICLDSSGNELWKEMLDISSNIFTAQLMAENHDNTYVMFGLLKPFASSADESIVKITFDVNLKSTEIEHLADGYGTCVSYQNNSPYILLYASDLSSILIYPAE